MAALFLSLKILRSYSCLYRIAFIMSRPHRAEALSDDAIMRV